MANYYATARSNYFRVKDVINFREWAEARNLRVVQNDDTFAIFSEEDNGWPSITDNDEDCDVIEELSAHLATNEVPAHDAHDGRGRSLRRWFRLGAAQQWRV